MDEPPKLAARYGEYLTTFPDGSQTILGSGGFGVTVKAFREQVLGGERFEDLVAIKILRQDAVSGGVEFAKEIQVLRNFEHPNLVSYKGCGEQDGTTYLVMELCEGGDLAALVQRFGPLPETLALRVILQVCNGLEDVHRAGYVHRDIKPKNILLRQKLPEDADINCLELMDCRFKLLDFGLAGKLGDSKGGHFAGTEMYASPEQIRVGALDSRSDIYSLGMTLWYLVAGKGPLLDARGNELRGRPATMLKHTSAEEHESSFPSSLSPGFRAILSKMVSKRAQNRFRFAVEIADAIRNELSRNDMQVSEPATEVPNAIPVASLAIDSDWGIGSAPDYFDIIKSVGRRGFVSLYRALWKRTGEVVSLSAWDARSPADSPSEQGIRDTMRTIWEACNAGNAPSSILKVMEVRRTDSQWCVAEQWASGTLLSDWLSARRKVDLQEMMRLLWPIARACDHIATFGLEHARLSVGEIRIQGGSAEDSKWVRIPLEQLGQWSVKMSLLSLPEDFGKTVGQQSRSNNTFNGPFEADFASLNLRKSFCCLLYRLIEGSDVPEIVLYGDEESYQDANRLSTKSNELLREFIFSSGSLRTTEPEAVSSILREICKNESLYRLLSQLEESEPPPPPLPRSAPAVASGNSVTILQIPKAPREADPPPPIVQRQIPPPPTAQPQIPPPPTAQPQVPPPPVAQPQVPPPPVAPPMSRSTSAPLGNSRNLTTMGRSAPVVKTAKLDPSRLGSVFSPHHPNESQAVDPKLWKPKGRVLCRETQFEFQLPAEIPPLHAKFVPGQFNIVKSPYRDEEVPVDEGEWHSGATFNCPASGEPFVMPPDLPLPEAEVPSSPGIVLSPYVGEEVAISPEHWLPGNQIDCPYCKCPFTLPSNLPEFLAEPQEAVGTFKSPYAPGSVFKLEPHECIPGNTVVCISSKRKLKIPASLPPSWVFSGVFRQGVLPEVKSPFTVESEWKPVPAKDWKQGAQFRCNRTGLTFVVSDPPPVLSVKCGEPAPSIISPFSPHPRLELSKSDWKPDAELTVEFEAGIPCNIRLPIDLPKLLEEPPPPPQPPAQRETPQPPASSHSVGNSRILRTPPTLKPARIDHSRPGVVYSPHGGRNEQLIPPKDWEPKGIIQCAETGQNFVLPLELPAREAIVIAGRYDAVMSPYREFEIPVSGNEWHPGAKVVCPATGRDVVMPEQLPPPLAEVSQRAIGFVVSPYTGEEIEVSPEQWAGGQKIVCPNSQLEFLLPSDLPLLLALPQSKAGEIVSPYEKTKPFEIPAWECKPDKEIACKHTGRPLRLPPTLPSDWQFSGPARQADIPQIRSPFFPKLDQAWQPISASDWRTGATITCEKTGRPFTVSGDLPVLDVKAGAECPQILSPFPPHTPVAISTENWKPGAEVSIKVAENALCKVRLPKELPLPVAELSRSAVGSVISPYTDNEIEIPPAKWVAGQKIHCPHSELEFLLPGELPLLLAILKPKAGTVVSPYEKSKPFELPAWDCKPGKEITCKHTGKALRLPPALPTEWAFTGPVRQAEIPQVHSPFYANTDQAWQPIGAEDWRSGSTIICEKTGRAFLVSGELPILNVKAAPEPLQILSPFPPHSPLTVSSEQWKPGAEISLKLSEKATCTVRLPKDLPLPIAELSNRAVGFVKSPYTGTEIEIPPTHWIDGQKFHCPHSKLDFLLPSALPLLIARPQSKPGEFVSPYETSKPFEIPAWDCKPGKEIVCKHTGKQLRLPPVLPTDWVFAGPVRQADVPQVRSPFCPKLDQAWQAVAPEDWRTGAEIVCEKTGRPFVMAGDLPILNVLAAPEPFQILSPFPPHSPISVARVQWKPEAEIVVSVPEKFSFTVRLPKDLPLPVAKLSPRATGSVISPYTSNEIEISPSDWDRSKRIRCPHSKLEFLLPDELPYLLVIPQSRAGEIISPYEKSKPFDIPAWQCEPNQEISCKHTGKRLRLPPTLPTSWAFFGRTRQGDAPQVQSPFVPNLEDAWQPIPAADWWAGAAITCKKTRKAFLVSDDIPILNVETAAEPLLVLSPFPPHSPISISTDDWKPGAEVSINVAENVACKVRLPDNLPSLGDVDLDDPVFASLPRGKQPKAKGSKGLIQSPFTQKPQPVLGKHWLPGIKLTCVDTGQDFWLPKNLPPLDAVVTDIPGTIISPYSESAISVSPDDWESGKKILCPESDAYIVLPKPLPSLEAILSPDKPGVVFSPYHPTVPVQLSYTDWKVGKQLKCPRSARPIALPDELPEWICDAEVFPKKPLWAREPDGTRITVDVSPNDWVAGGIIKLPTGRRLRLPDSLPPLVAQLVEDGPGYIRSPFADPTYEYNIPRKLWQPGGIISCPATARPLKLPDTLPKLPSSLPKIASIVIVIAVIAAVILTLLKLILRS